MTKEVEQKKQFSTVLEGDRFPIVVVGLLLAIVIAIATTSNLLAPGIEGILVH